MRHVLAHRPANKGCKGHRRHKNTHEKPAFVGAGRHLQDHDRARLRTGGFVMVSRMHTLEFLDDHRFAHAAIAIQQQARHPGAAWLLDQFI